VNAEGGAGTFGQKPQAVETGKNILAEDVYTTGENEPSYASPDEIRGESDSVSGRGAGGREGDNGPSEF
jgi:hypothetical protein